MRRRRRPAVPMAARILILFAVAVCVADANFGKKEGEVVPLSDEQGAASEGGAEDAAEDRALHLLAQDWRRAAPKGTVVDCAVGSWGVWGSCTRSCGGGIRVRARVLLTQPQHGGRACPLLTDTLPCGTEQCKDGDTGQAGQLARSSGAGKEAESWRRIVERWGAKREQAQEEFEDHYYGDQPQGNSIGEGVNDAEVAGCVCDAVSSEHETGRWIVDKEFGPGKRSPPRTAIAAPHRRMCHNCTLGGAGVTQQWHAFVSHIVIINLKRRPAKREYMRQLLLHLGVPEHKFRFFDAIDVKQWGTEAQAARLRRIFGLPAHELLARNENDCCWRRLKDHKDRCDVSHCGLKASGLSHIAAVREWVNQHSFESGTSARGIMVLEDDVCSTPWMHTKSAHAKLPAPPENWDLVRLEDCNNGKGNDQVYFDRKCELGSQCNEWRLARERRTEWYQTYCASAYALTLKSAMQYARDWSPVFPPLQPWIGSEAPIEHTLNALAFEAWPNSSYQPVYNLFSQGGPENLDGEVSDNHPHNPIMLGGRRLLRGLDEKPTAVWMSKLETLGADAVNYCNEPGD